MKINRMLFVAAILFALPVFAAEGVPGSAIGRDGHAAQREKMCEQNPEKCREMKAKMEQRREACKADPGKCRQERQTRAAEHFRKSDADGNGTLSRTEAEKNMPRLARHFDAIDANKDGQLSREELNAAHKARQGAKGPARP